MKVLFIIDSLGMGGKERRLIELLKELNIKSVAGDLLVVTAESANASDVTAAIVWEERY